MANGINVALPEGTELDITNFGDFPLYYTAKNITNVARNQIYLYNAVVGDPSPIVGVQYTELDTNLYTKNSLGYAEEMAIMAIACELPQQCVTVPTTPVVDHPFQSDMRAIAMATYFELRVAQSLYSEGPITEYPFGGGLFVQSTENVSEQVTNGVPQSATMRPLAMGIKVTSKDTFAAKLRWPNGYFGTAPVQALVGMGATGYDLRWWLYALRAKYQGTSK